MSRGALYGGGLIAILVFSWFYRAMFVRLAEELFGPGAKVRYIPKRWVIEGTQAGLAVRYTCGFNFFRARSFLLVSCPVHLSFSVTSATASSLPGAGRDIVRALQTRDGFDRLDVVDDGAAWFNVAGRVTWNHPGPGILLRRLTKHGGEAAFVQEDLRLLSHLARVVG